MRWLAPPALVFAVLLTASASAQPVSYIGETAESFVSDSRQLLSDGGPGVIRTFDPLRRKAGRLAIDAGCRLGAVGTRTAAIGCPTGGVYVLDTVTGQRMPLPNPVADIGLNWARYTTPVPDGGRAGSQTYLNWRTGERRLLDIHDDTPIDLDSVAFRRVKLRLAGRPLIDSTALGDLSVVARLHKRRPGADVTLVSRMRARVERLGRCALICTGTALTAREAAWIDEQPSNLRRTVVKAVDLRTGRHLSWTVPMTRQDGTRILTIAGRLLLSIRASGSLNAPHRLFRLKPS